MNSAPTSRSDPTAFAGLWALVHLLFRVIANPGAHLRLDALLEHTERKFARKIFEIALRNSGRTDINPDDFSVRLVWKNDYIDFVIERRVPAQVSTRPTLPARRTLPRLNRVTQIRLRLERRTAAPRARAQFRPSRASRAPALQQAFAPP